MFTCTNCSFLLRCRSLLEPLELWGPKTFYCAKKKTALWHFVVVIQYCDLCAVDKFRILNDMNNITALAYLTASYLNCAKWIGFTVQMFLCMVVFFLLSMCVSLSPLECVSEAFFSWELPLWRFCLARLLLSPGIHRFHNFPFWMFCIKLQVVETTLKVFFHLQRQTSQISVLHDHTSTKVLHQSRENTQAQIVQILVEIVVIAILLFFDISLSARQASFRKGSIIAACVVWSLRHRRVCLTSSLLCSADEWSFS